MVEYDDEPIWDLKLIDSRPGLWIFQRDDGSMIELPAQTLHAWHDDERKGSRGVAFPLVGHPGLYDFRAYLDQSLKRAPALDEAKGFRLGWSCDARPDGFTCPAWIVPGEGDQCGQFVKDGTDAAISILKSGEKLRGEAFVFVHSAIRKMTYQAEPDLVFEQHYYYKTMDGSIIDLDYSTQTATIITAEQFGAAVARRAERVRSDLVTLVETGFLDITYGTAWENEIVAALNATPLRVNGGEGGGSHLGWRQAYYTLPDGRTLRIGNGPDEGWTTASIR